MGKGLRASVACAVMVLVIAACDPFTWTRPIPAVQSAPFQHPIALTGVGCLSTSLCLAWDSRGEVLTSTSPSGGTWKRTQLAGSAINALSCASASLCVAVDALGGLYSSTNPAGGIWSARVVVDGTTSINGISCTSNPSLLCVAVDKSGNAITSTNPTGNASQWAVHYVGEFGDALDAVSCASTTMCVAVGEFGYILGSSNPAGGTSWTPETTQNADIILDSVACPQTNLCVAVDKSGDVWSSGSPLSTAWAVKSVGPTNAVACTLSPSILCLAVNSTGSLYWSTNPLAQTWTAGGQIDAGHSLTGVRCLSTTFCFAVDNGGRVQRSVNPTNGAAAWTTPTQIDGYNQLNGVSCTATPTSLCVEVDQAGNASISGLSSPTVIDSGHVLSGISCPKASLCVAVDTAGFVVWSTNPTGGAGAWSRASIDGGNVLSAVSCTVTPTTLCLATDTNTGKIWHSTNPSAGGSSWTNTAFTGSALYGVSCATTTLCAVVGQIGDAWASNNPTGPGSAWHGENVEGGSRPIFSVSCVVSPSTLCVAVDSDGGILHSTNPVSAVWTGFTAGLENVALESVSCPSSARCVAVDGGGDTLSSVTPTGTQSDWVITEHTPCTNAEKCGSTGDGSAFSGVSCSTVKFCVAVDVLGEQVTGTASS